MLAAACLFGGAILIPALFRSPMLGPIGVIFSSVAWHFAFLFGVIALLRYLRQNATVSTAASFPRSAPPSRMDGTTRPTASVRPSPAELSKAWLEPVLPRTPATPPRPESWSLDVLDRVEWKRFEDLCCAFYREEGIRAETTRLGADGGIDVRLFQDDTTPARATAIVQCKAWNKQVGVKEVRELRGVMAHEKVEKAFFMAPNGYTDDARSFAAENRITLLDGKLFLAMLLRLPEEASKRLLAFATEGDWTTPTCPGCGDRMTARDSKRGPFWGCVSYPKCHAKLGMRARPAAGI